MLLAETGLSDNFYTNLRPIIFSVNVLVHRLTSLNNIPRPTN
jgi:hypothetical protein